MTHVVHPHGSRQETGDDAAVAAVANTIADLAYRVQNEIDGHGDEASSLAAGVVSDQSDDHSTLVNLLGLSEPRHGCTARGPRPTHLHQLCE
jgi:hypothetical protein